MAKGVLAPALQPYNKVVLPPASKPWPIKGAAYKPAFIPTMDLPEEEDLFGTPSKAKPQPTTESRSEARIKCKILPFKRANHC